MGVQGVEQARKGFVAARLRPRLALTREALAGYLLIAPAILYILVLVGYPFLLALYFSVSDATVASVETKFVGLTNFAHLFDEPSFRKGLQNSLIFTFGSAAVKGLLGTGLAFLLLRPLRGKKVLRAFVMLPWTLPISLSILGWRWMFDPQFSVINYTAARLGLIHRPYPDWLGDPVYAFIAVLITNIWRGFPFGAVIVLAGLTSIPPDILDAAKIDGASWFQRWRFVITPIIAPILFIGLIFDVVFTLGDLTVVYNLTKGGPVSANGNATDVLPFMAFQTGILGGDLARGAATSLFLFPMLLLGIVIFLRSLHRRDF
jgi:multiple sugar transport system permease protein